MSFFGGSSGSQVKPQYTGIQLQTSSSTQAITLLWGMNRVAPNIFWYNDFKSVKEETKAGKGFGGNVTSYTYSASIMLGLCQGPITGVNRVFRNQDKTTDYTSLGFSLFLGNPGQAAWGYLTSSHPDQALSYSNVAYVAAANYNLGSSATTPQHSFEVKGFRYNTAINGEGDADPALIIQDLLTDPTFGAGFSSGSLDLDQLLSSSTATTTGDATYQTYCRALGLGFSPALSSQESAGTILDRWAQLSDTAVVWTGYSLKMIPYGTEPISANGYNYVPNVTAAYNLTDNDYIVARGEAPLKITRSDPSDANNSIKLNVRNRNNEYNDAPVEWKDQGLIDLYQLRQGSNIDAPEVCSLDMGSLIISLIGQRLAYGRNSYELTLPINFCRLEPMDILLLDDPTLGPVAVWADELEEQDDFTWKITAKEIPPGIAKAAQAQAISNNPINTGVTGGPVNEPIIFQPPLDLTDGDSQIWAGISGGDGTLYNPNWGGAYVYVSTDGVSYQQIGQINSAARSGFLSSALPAYSSANPDTVNTLAVDLQQSNGVLQSVSASEASREATLSYVGGELISFRDATLTATNRYGLSTLYRGLHGTTPGAHASGEDFMRLDDNIFKYTLPSSYVGLTLFFKFQSFNIWGSGVQDLADCVEYTYTPSGPTLGAPRNIRTQLGNTSWTGNILTVYCDAITGADTYLFEFYLTDGTTLRKSASSSVPSVTYTSAEAASGGVARVYRVRARAFVGGTPGPWSALTTVTNTSPPQVTGVSASGGVGSGSVSFSLITTDDDIGGYVIYYSTTSGFNPSTSGTPIPNSGSSPQSITGLSPGTYYAVVAAYDNWTQDPSLLNFSSQVSFVVT